MLALLAETNAKNHQLFGPVSGDCNATQFSPVSAGSSAAAAFTSTSVPGWTMLYTDAIEPPYNVLQSLTLADNGGNAKCYVGFGPEDIGRLSAAGFPVDPSAHADFAERVVGSSFST